MATRRNNESTSGALVGTVVFGISTLVLMIFLGLYVKDYNAEFEKREKADKALKEFVTNPQRGSSDYTTIKALADENRQSVYAQMSYMLSQKERLLGVEPNASNEDIRIKFDIETKTAKEGEDEPVQTALLDHYSAVRDERNKLDAMLKSTEGNLQSANKMIKSLNDDMANLVTKHRTSLNTSHNSLESEMKNHKVSDDDQAGKHDALVQNAQTKFSKLTGDVESKKKEVKVAIGKNKELEDRIEKFLESRGDGTGTGIGSIKDGTIQAVVTGGKSVVLNLTRKDHVKPGMTFEVFSPRTGIAFIEGKNGELKRGIATIEIITVDDKGSTAAVVRLERGVAVQKDDWIANVAYDPKAKINFVVHGMFDLEGSGLATNSDRKKIEAIIHNYRSGVMKELSFQTDFLVVGETPVSPRQLSDDASQREIEIYKAAKIRYEQYNAVVNKALELHVPILSQNRFMAEVGHYKR